MATIKKKILLSARFGRQNIALYRFEDVELPTDLSGFTYINAGKLASPAIPKGVALDPKAVATLREWATSLGDTITGIPRTSVVHGYSGKWRVRLSFQRWRGLELKEPSYATVNGYLTLYIPISGEKGEGIAHGEMSVHLVDQIGTKEEFLASIRVMDLILDVHCYPDASIRFISETYVRHVMEQAGTPWTSQITAPVFPAANSFNWRLCSTDAQGRVLTGTYQTDDPAKRKASVFAEKVF